MLAPVGNVIISANLLEHPAAIAWNEFRSKSVKPVRIEVLKQQRREPPRSAVYRLVGAGPAGSSVIAKRCQQSSALRERTIYEDIFSQISIPALEYFGFQQEPEGLFCWLFLGDAGEEEYSPHIEEHRVLAARWLGLMHISTENNPLQHHLADRGADHYFEQLQAGRERIVRSLSNPALTDEDVSVLEAIVERFGLLESRWSEVEDLCEMMPHTLVHCDFVPKNIRIGRTGAGNELMCFDWEQAGFGVPAVDFAECHDLSQYTSVVRERWSYLDRKMIERLADIGKLFRQLLAISWESAGLKYEWVDRAMRRMRAYESRLPCQSCMARNAGTMNFSSCQLPDTETLKSALTSVLRKGSGNNQVDIVARGPNPYSSTAPAEIVRCRLHDGRELQLLCKYGGHSFYSYGARGGVEYETEVYRRVLKPMGLSPVAYYGVYEDLISGEKWLFLEYLDDCLRLDKAPQPTSMISGARWLGRFHAAAEERLSTAAIQFLNEYDFEYYLGWGHRTSQFARGLQKELSWIETLCEGWEEVANALLLPSDTIIHGEYYPKNILTRDGQVYPVDWESAAIAVGEIDLATLTENWSEEIVQTCESEYKRARWPEGAPAHFERRLNAARLYLQLRWLGDPEYRTLLGQINLAPYFIQLRALGERLALI